MDKEQTKILKRIRELLYGSEHAVFFGGAGVSTDSGIPDFRGMNGLYRQDESYEYLLSRTCLDKEPQKFYDFYREKMLYPLAKPNKTHYALAQLEKAGIIKAVITQNIDGLHEKAGSRSVIELHGTENRNYCMRCKRVYNRDIIEKSEGLPLCLQCGGLIRPDVTLYEEALPSEAFYEAAEHIARADLLIAGGSSLRVFPAAGFVADFSGKHLVIVNLTPTPYDDKAEYVVRQPLSEFFSQLL